MTRKYPLIFVMTFSFLLAACNPQDPATSGDETQEEVKVDPSLPSDPGADELIGDDSEEVNDYTVSLSLNKKAYRFYADESQVISGTVDSNSVKSVRLAVDGIIEKSVDVASKKFSLSMTFYDATTGNLRIEALDSSGEVVGAKSVFYQVVVRPIDRVTDKRAQFEQPEPDLGQATPLTLWATSYWLPRVANKASGYALRDLSGNSLGANVTNREWCDAAMEGSIQIKYDDGRLITYNYAGTSSSNQVDCSSYYNHPASHKVKFREATGEYGDGVGNYLLVPHRSIAVDPSVIPYGSVVYIPSARGNVMKLPSGETFVHDGFYLAVDTGGLIKQNHIDVFRGTDEKVTQSWIKSSSSGTFKAYIVEDANIEQFLEEIHH